MIFQYLPYKRFTVHPKTGELLMAYAEEWMVERFLERGYPIVWWYHHAKKRRKLVLCMEVGPLDDPDVRLRLLRELKKAGFSFQEKGAFRPEAKYTRILSKRQQLRTDEEGESDESEQYLREVATSLWKKAWNEGENVVDVLKRFKWSAR